MADGLRKAEGVFMDHPGNRNHPADVILLISYSRPDVEVSATIAVADRLKKVMLLFKVVAFDNELYVYMEVRSYKIL